MNILRKTHSIGLVLILCGTILALITIVIIGPFNTVNTDKIGTINIINLANKQRSLQDIKPLSTNADLVNAAQKKAEALAKQFELNNNIQSQIPAWEYLKEVNYPFKLAGENIAIGGFTNQDIIEGWMQSITHKTNIINSSYSDIGVGVASFYSAANSQNRNITVALFATQTNDGKTNVSEPTFPAGPLYITASSYNLASKLLLIFSFTLIVIGGYIEYRQVLMHHRSQNFKKKSDTKSK